VAAREDSFNGFVKRALVGRFTLINLFLEILKIEHCTIRTSRESIGGEIVFSHPLMDWIKFRYSRWSFEQMVVQFGLSFDLVVKASELRHENF